MKNCINYFKNFFSSKINIVLTLIYSFIISISTWLKYLMSTYNTIDFLNYIKFNSILFLLIIFIITTIINTILFSIVSKIIIQNKKHKPFNNKKLFIISFTIMFIIYLICFLTYFPGAGLYDTFMELDGPIKSSAQHPLFFNSILYFFIVVLGNKLLGSSIIGWSIFSIFQMLLVISSISYFIVWINKKDVSRLIIIILILIFSIFPIYATYSIYATKDILFSITILLSIPLLYDLVESNGEKLKTKKFNIMYLIFGTVLIFIRNNGIFIFVPLTIILIIKYFKCNIKYITTILVCLLILNSGISLIIKNMFNVEHYFKETVAIPIQQVSSVVYTDGNMTNKEKEFVNNMLNLDTIKKVYNRGNVDYIKWNSSFNTKFLQENKKEFIVLWKDLLFKNFNTYVGSYLYQTSSFWQINLKANNTDMYIDMLKNTTDNDYIEHVKDKYKLHTKKLFSNNIYSKLVNNYEKYTNFLSEGTCFLIYLLLICILIIKKQSKYIIAFLPLLFIWLTLMISTPLASSLRYMYPFILSIPFMFAIVLNLKTNK